MHRKPHLLVLILSTPGCPGRGCSAMATLAALALGSGMILATGAFTFMLELCSSLPRTR